MKEILKYLRSVNSYSQEKVAESIGLSRQSYNKYEVGTVIPSDKIVKKLADLYNVTSEFIKKNQIPQIPGKKCKSVYSNEKTGDMAVASSAPAYCVNTIEKTEESELPKQRQPLAKTYRAVYHHGKIELQDETLNFSEGQELLISVRAETEKEKQARKKKAWQVIEDYIKNRKFTFDDSDSDYDKLRWEALNEKYGPF